MTNKTIEAIETLSLRLFNKGVIISDDNNNNMTKEDYLKNYGFAILVENFDKFSKRAFYALISAVKAQYPSAEELSKTLFKSWKYVENATEEQLVIDHILNYLSVYGLGMDKHYDPRLRRKEAGVKVKKDTIIVDLEKFIEAVNNYAPEDIVINKDEFIFVETMELDEFKAELNTLLTKNIALDNKEVRLIQEILKDTSVYKKEELEEIFENIKNKEIYKFLVTELKLISKDPQRFLENLIYLITYNTLFIKNKQMQRTIYNIINNDPGLSYSIVLEQLEQYINKFGIERLASIYLRNKPIFLALKKASRETCNDDVVRIINKLNKVAKKGAHKPYKIPDYLKIIFDKSIDLDKVLKDLDINYLVRIANALIYRIKSIKDDSNVLLFHIRNGKGYYKEVELKKKKFYKKRLKKVKEELERRINQLIQDKKIVLKNFKESVIDYAIPTSGKKFVYNIPFGSTINAPEKGELVAGIFWSTEGKNYNVDFDLSFVNEAEKIGWNGYYRNDNVLFSGDMVDSTRGAAELLLVKDRKDILYKVTNNLFNRTKHDTNEEPFKFFIGTLGADKRLETYVKEGSSDRHKRYKLAREVERMIDDKLLASVPLAINVEEGSGLELGLMYEKGFVFASLSTAKYVSEVEEERAFKAFKNKALSYIKFSDLDLVSYEPDPENEEEEVVEIDFNNISKKDLLSLVTQ